MELVPYNYNQVAVTTVDDEIAQNGTPQIDLTRLLAARRHMSHQKNKVYKAVLRLCHRRIEFEACKRVDRTWCIYEVPLFVVGLPRFDTAACTRYCYAKLRANGLDVSLLSSRTLHISWQRVEDRALKRARKLRKQTYMGIRRKKSTSVDRLLSHGGKGSHLDTPAPRLMSHKQTTRPPAFGSKSSRVRFIGVPSQQRG